MKRATTRLCAAVALTFTLVLSLARCSDDGETPVDQGPASDAPLTTDQGGGADQAAGTDQATGTDQGGPADGGGGPKNSGALCSASTPCADTREGCLYFGGPQGMCLAPCAKQGDPCPVLNKATQLATCSIKGLDPSKWFCGYLCEVGGKSYACPGAAGYDCVAASNPSFKFCEPH